MSCVEEYVWPGPVAVEAELTPQGGLTSGSGRAELTPQ